MIWFSSYDSSRVMVTSPSLPGLLPPHFLDLSCIHMLDGQNHQQNTHVWWFSHHVAICSIASSMIKSIAMFHHLSSIQPPYFSTFKTFHGQPPQVFTIFGRSTRASAPSPSGRCRPPPGRRAAARRPLGRRRGRAWGCHSLGDFAKKDGWICFDICYTLQGLSIYIIYIYYYIHYVYSFLYSHTYIIFIL